MKFEISRHAKEEIKLRGISEITVENILNRPGQIVKEYGNKKAYQSIIELGSGEDYLIRVIIDDTVEPAKVVTVYKTSKIEKYWRRP